MPGDWVWDESLFAGTARHYRRGRLPYAPALAARMAEALGLDGGGRLLDAGCGPGTVTLLLAHLFERAVGLDPDTGMLEEAARAAAEQDVRNVEWVRLRAEELPAGLGTFRVVTFAQSFHWMDRLRVARAVRAMLEPGGALVHVDSTYQDGIDPGDGAPYPAPPDAAVDELRRRYLGARRRAGKYFRDSSPDREDLVYREAGFAGPEVVAVPGWGLVERTVDQEFARVLSTSATAPHLFGDRLAEFERDLRALLAAASPAGRFSVRLGDNRLLIWR
jgi:ubiquinone/menaquinone biosynthesis C-methylase UbiE